MGKVNLNNELILKLHDLNYVITDEEIINLSKLCYSYSCSFFPIGDFFNDIRDNNFVNYNKNQAFKDLYLIMLHFDFYYRNFNKRI